MQLEFNDVDNRIYVVDTSGLIRLESTFPYDNPTFSAIWEEIEYLIQKGRFRIIDFVEDEINSYEGKQDFLKRWVKKWRRHILHETDEECIIAAKPIINQEYNTGFFTKAKQAEGKEEADPYLIGYCKVKKCVLITNEDKNKPNKIPQVAAKHGVECMDINDFLQDRGLIMKRTRLEG